MSPSSERLHSQIWLHRFVVISLCIISLGAIICDINTIGFVSVSAQCACKVRDALVAMLCNRSLGDATVHEKNGRPTLNRGMTRLMYTSSAPTRHYLSKNAVYAHHLHTSPQ